SPAAILGDSRGGRGFCTGAFVCARLTSGVGQQKSGGSKRGLCAASVFRGPVDLRSHPRRHLLVLGGTPPPQLTGSRGGLRRRLCRLSGPLHSRGLSKRGTRIRFWGAE